jgi:hypothetical protein
MARKTGDGTQELPEAQELTVRDEDGLVVLQIGFSITFYFKEGHTQPVRERVAQCFDIYRLLCGPHLKWAHPGNRGFQKLDKPADKDPSQWLREPDSDGQLMSSGWEFYWHGGKTKEEANHFRVTAVGAASRHGDELSFFSASLPLSWFADHEGSFPSLAMKWCQILKPEHGYGGLSILESPRLSIAQTHGAVAYAMARRFPGLELDDPTTHVLYLKDGIKGGNWLTVLSEQWLDKLGGISVLSQKLGPEFQFYPYVDGAVIQAGPTPELGDVNRQLIPVRYRHLAQVLRPIRAPLHSGFHGFGLTREKSEEWLARFDNV